MDVSEVDEDGQGTSTGLGQLISASSAASASSCSCRLGHGPQGMIIDQRKSNAIIEKSNFPGATVAPNLEKQKTVAYHDCTFIYNGQSEHHETFNSLPGSGQNSRRDSVVLAEDSSRRTYDCRPPEDQSMQYPLESQVSFSLSSEGAASSPDFTRVSDKISFYNVEPLRPGTRIYKGKQKHAVDISRDIAVKLVPYQNLHEIKILLDLAEHMNIVNIIESDVIFGHVREIYIAMELCSQNLREYVLENENTPENFEKNASYSKQLMTGLDFIHSNNVIHTDLKPDNILFSQSQKSIKISDFGLGKYLNCDISANKAPSLVGADGFRAPEMYCVPPKVSKSSDVFSMGVIIFYLLTNGNHPFGDSPHDWNYHIRHYKNRDLSRLEYVHALPYKKKQLLNILSAILHQVPEARPPTLEILASPFFEGMESELVVLMTFSCRDSIPGVSCHVEDGIDCETRPKSVEQSTSFAECSHASASSMQDFRRAEPRVSSPEPIACDSPAECSSPTMAESINEAPQTSNYALPPTPSQGFDLFSPLASSSTTVEDLDVKSPFPGWLTHKDLANPLSPFGSLFSPAPRQPCTPIVLSDDSRPATAHATGFTAQPARNPQPPPDSSDDDVIIISSDEEDG